MPMAYASGLQISNVQLAGFRQLRFTISWENSWRLQGAQPPYNHDAAWVFVKYKGQDGVWRHLGLSPNNNDHIAGSDAEIEAVADGKGIFVKRANTGAGSLNTTITLKWSSGLEGQSFHFKVMGMEMVHVPEGEYYLGDGKGQYTFRRGDANTALHITSANEIKLGKDSLSLNDTGKWAPAGPVPAAWPNGYGGFYCMKYEISQEQYVGFLNCLSYAQQIQRTAASPASAAGTSAFKAKAYNRNGVVVKDPSDGAYPAVYACDANNEQVFNNTDDGQDRAMNFLNWGDVAAYLDWAALRPMTEMEFEKICRGGAYPLPRDFAWGTDKVTDANTLINDGTNTESVSEIPPAGYGLASHGYDGPQGPLRCGFGATANSSRLQAGAACYGALEMSGNLWEMCVTVNENGLLYDGHTGDGELDADGRANVPYWPADDADGAGYRGGAFNSGVLAEFSDPSVSERFYAGQPPATRRATNGGRGVR